MSVSSTLTREAAEWLMQQEAKGTLLVPPEHFATTVIDGRIQMDPLTTIDFRNGRNVRRAIEHPKTKPIFERYVAKLLKSNTVMHLAADRAKQAGKSVSLSMMGCGTMPEPSTPPMGQHLLAASSSDHTGRRRHTRHTIRYPRLSKALSALPLRQLMMFTNTEGGLPKMHSIGAGRASNPEAAEAFVAMMTAEGPTVPMTAFVVNNVATLETTVPAERFDNDSLKEDRAIATSSNKFPGTAIKLPPPVLPPMPCPPAALRLEIMGLPVAKVTPELFSSPPANDIAQMPAPRRRTRSRSKHRSGRPYARPPNAERVRAILPGVISAESLVQSVRCLAEIAVAPHERSELSTSFP
jgi:hypothetical protein